MFKNATAFLDTYPVTVTPAITFWTLSTSNPNHTPLPQFNTGVAADDNQTLKDAIDLYVNSKSKSIATDTYGEIKDWDTSTITDMSSLFKNKQTFNEDISNWDVSNVTTMENMFENASLFNNGDESLNTWNTSKVTNMRNMFKSAEVFNQSINTNVQNAGGSNEYVAWDVSNVTNMSYMFYDDSDNVPFNQPLNKWDTSAVTNMSYMFKKANVFNQNLTQNTVTDITDTSYEAWDVSQVTNMQSMFDRCAKFNNGSIDSNGDSSTEAQNALVWNTASVINMREMFLRCTNFNSEMVSEWSGDSDNLTITTWDLSNVEDAHAMFENCTNFEQEIRTWNMKPLFDLHTSRLTENGYEYNVVIIGDMFLYATAFLDNSNWNTFISNSATPLYTLYKSYNGNGDEGYPENPHYDPDWNV